MKRTSKLPSPVQLYGTAQALWEGRLAIDANDGQRKVAINVARVDRVATLTAIGLELAGRVLAKSQSRTG